jgi:hypothetical protein
LKVAKGGRDKAIAETKATIDTAAAEAKARSPVNRGALPPALMRRSPLGENVASGQTREKSRIEFPIV